MARKHDLVMIQVSDKRETQLPKLGIIPVFDKESNKTVMGKHLVWWISVKTIATQHACTTESTDYV
ncbi:MAG: hypothetical protein U5K54_27530 [Cytophagales bacterium]|nr:hypothetical protein [Cytophagales bacterium]